MYARNAQDRSQLLCFGDCEVPAHCSHTLYHVNIKNDYNQFSAMNQKNTPPPAIDCASVIEFAVVDETVQFQQRGCLFVDGQMVGQVPKIAICQNIGGSTFMIFHCGPNWEAIGVQGDYPNLPDAKSRIEESYLGLHSKWIASSFSREESVEYVKKIFKGEECSFCGRIPPEVERMVGKNEVRICNHCIEKFSVQ